MTKLVNFQLLSYPLIPLIYHDIVDDAYNLLVIW